MAYWLSLYHWILLNKWKSKCFLYKGPDDNTPMSLIAPCTYRCLIVQKHGLKMQLVLCTSRLYPERIFSVRNGNASCQPQCWDLLWFPSPWAPFLPGINIQNWDVSRKHAHFSTDLSPEYGLEASNTFKLEQGNYPTTRELGPAPPLCLWSWPAVVASEGTREHPSRQAQGYLAPRGKFVFLITNS